MVVINIRNKVIPIDFGEFQFEFSKSDENIEKMQSFAQDLQLEAQKIVDEDGKGDVTKAREILKLAYNGIFGDGSFDKVYNLSGQSTVDCINYFIEIMQGVEQEQISKESQELLDRYLGK
jgi:hypothetical protein|nr:MAG TPA: hypothetical protein [Caudoviricetes sp.]